MTVSSRLDNARKIRAPRGLDITARSWQTEAAMRMLMNNLDQEVAEKPEALVVYGGIGRAARDWESYDRIVAARSEEHTSELQSLMRTSYAVFCLKKKNYIRP